MSGLSVLVLGGSYFIGKKIVSILIKHGFSVTTLNRGTKLNIHLNVTNIIADRNDAAQMESVLKGREFDYVVDVSALNRSQIEIACSSLNRSKLQKYIFISSSAVYDIDNYKAPYLENTPLAANRYWGEYGANKIEAEQELAKQFKRTLTEVVILRPPYVYGEDNYAQRESFIFDHIVNKKPIFIPNQGETRLQFIYTTDLANIIVELISIPTAPISIYNVGNRDSVSVKEWIAACAEVCDIETEIVLFNYASFGFEIRDFFPFYDYDNVLDVTTINYIYDTETPFTAGLTNAYKWYLKNQSKIAFKPQIIENEKNIKQLLTVK